MAYEASRVTYESQNLTYVPRHAAPFQHQIPGLGNLDLSAPGFDPNEAELPRYSLAPFYQPGQMIVRQELASVGDVARIESMARQHEAEISLIKAGLSHDLQLLHAELRSLRAQVSDHGHVQHEDQPKELAVIKTGPTVIDWEPAPIDEMVKRFDKDVVAKVYLEQAEVIEEIARKIRKDVSGLQDVAAAPPQHEGQNRPRIDSVTRSQEINQKSATSSRDTSTDAPAGRAAAQVASQAIEIEAPSAAAPAEHPSESATAAPSPALTTASSESIWIPRGVKDMPPTPASSIPDTQKSVFSWEFLKSVLGGEQYSPAFYFGAHSKLVPGRSYWLLEREYEPFAPVSPGQHGAKLTAFINGSPLPNGEAPDPDSYMRTPVFIRKAGKTGYVYFGHYSQKRFADKLDHDHVMSLPEIVREYWVTMLAASPNNPRPKWLTEALMEHFWPKPSYYGPLPTNAEIEGIADDIARRAARTAHRQKVKAAVDLYLFQLETWEKEARMKVNLLTQDVLRAAWKKPDDGGEPGLRLYLEYLECVEYDEAFSEALVQEKREGMARYAAKKARESAEVSQTDTDASATVTSNVKTATGPPRTNAEDQSTEQKTSNHERAGAEELASSTKGEVVRDDKGEPALKGLTFGGSPQTPPTTNIPAQVNVKALVPHAKAAPTAGSRPPVGVHNSHQTATAPAVAEDNIMSDWEDEENNTSPTRGGTATPPGAPQQANKPPASFSIPTSTSQPSTLRVVPKTDPTPTAPRNMLPAKTPFPPRQTPVFPMASLQEARSFQKTATAAKPRHSGPRGGTPREKETVPAIPASAKGKSRRGRKSRAVRKSRKREERKLLALGKRHGY